MATFELPGLKKDDVEIDLRNNRLVISGQSSTSEDVDTDDYALHERRIGKFSRALPIPTGTKVSSDSEIANQRTALILNLISARRYKGPFGKRAFDCHIPKDAA